MADKPGGDLWTSATTNGRYVEVKRAFRQGFAQSGKAVESCKARADHTKAREGKSYIKFRGLYPRTDWASQELGWQATQPPWRVNLRYTSEETGTGHVLKQRPPYVGKAADDVTGSGPQHVKDGEWVISGEVAEERETTPRWDNTETTPRWDNTKANPRGKNAVEVSVRDKRPAACGRSQSAIALLLGKQVTIETARRNVLWSRPWNSQWDWAGTTAHTCGCWRGPKEDLLVLNGRKVLTCLFQGLREVRCWGW